MSARDEAEKALQLAESGQYVVAGSVQALRGVAFAMLALADSVTAAAATAVAAIEAGKPKPPAAADQVTPSKRDLLIAQGIPVTELEDGAS